jgi:hypothetical protein
MRTVIRHVPVFDGAEVTRYSQPRLTGSDRGYAASDLSPLATPIRTGIREDLRSGRGLAYGLGGSPGVLAQNLAVVARDLRAHLEVRVTGARWGERRVCGV